MEYLPIFFDVKSRPCLIVGGGDIAFRKAQSLIKSKAVVNVIAPSIKDELAELVRANGGQCFYRQFQADDVTLYFLIIAATDIEIINQQVSRAALAGRCLVNVVDNPELSNFISPAIVDRDPLVIAISSTGKVPVLARIFRTKIETLVPANFGTLASLVGEYRDQIKQRITSSAQRLRFWDKLLNSPAAEAALSGNIGSARQLIQKEIDEQSLVNLQGEVFLVGAGPGDPDLLTFKAMRLMQIADVVLYDRLVSDGIMNLVRKDAERIYVGKQRSEHTMAQTNINQLLVDLAKQGKRVLRLKGGDPFIFGRGGEEIELLAQENIPFQVVPGITAASGCASYAGIPLTHRDYAQSVRFITGHLKQGGTNLTFSDLRDASQTLVFYMGLVGLPDICQRLMEIGRSEDTPAALIEKGTTNEQRVFIGTLKDLPSIVSNHAVHAPTLVIVGDVVKLHHQLKWFRKDQS